ncbi:calcium homeostasis modulator protein 4-like [Chelmon rostratus]|uniref:calcium homeostasis modulator protein 4-like n=1 Tax=Chelmon rostratus TaxID=109905 RepID=UPI001BEBC325|nr:calcium homeostasis modulator protein 4-like [Chelmon rostratus]
MLHRSASASDASCSHSNMPWSSTITFFGFLPSAEDVVQSANRQIIVVMLLLCYHLWFQIDFACPCNSNRNFIHCYGYMVLPSLIIISLILWNDKRIGRIFRYACYHSSVRKGRCSYRGRFCFQFFIYLLQATSSGFLWCGSVLVDGDWYVCCGTDSSEELMLLSCMKEGEMGPAERATKVTLKNRSMVIGLICILLTAACSLVLVLPWNRWCTRRSHFRAAFEEAILEQTEVILRDEMGKAAAHYVAESLVSLSTTATTTTPSITKEDPEKVEKTEDKEKILLNINVNWEEIACLADALIEHIPNKVAKNKDTK